MKPSQHLPLLLVAVLAAVITFALIKRPVDEAPAPPPLVSLEKMGHLVSLKMNYSDVIEFTQPNAVDIPWSQWEVRLGSTRVLPAPSPLQARINHEPRAKGGSYFYAITDQGLQAFIPSAQTRTTAMNNVLATAQKAVQAACSQPTILNTARDNAATVMQATLLATGWTPTVVWEASTGQPKAATTP